MKTIFVDLDKTLINTDIFVESIFENISHDLLPTLGKIIRLPFGKNSISALKHDLHDRTEIDVSKLPYNMDLIAFLRERKSNGAEIILATAANMKIANQIASHLGIFDHVIASDASTNRKGTVKLDAIREYAGDRAFMYIGDSVADLPIWAEADAIGAVGACHFLRRRLTRFGQQLHLFDVRRDKARDLFRAVRPHQWVKNLLAFVPYIASQQWSDLDAALGAFIAFIALSFAASSIYIINDLFDLQADRQNAYKSTRPIAAGQVQVPAAILLSLGLAVAGLTLAGMGGRDLLLVIMLYMAASASYTFLIKKKLLVDVLWLSGLYTLRILAGAAASQIPASFWLLGFSIFIFLSLASAKRCAELYPLLNASGDSSTMTRRGYRADDMATMSMMGVASSFSAIIVLLLYLTNEDLVHNYKHPNMIILLAMLLLYLMGRIWIKVRRGEMHYDPILFVLKDKASMLTVLLIFVNYIMATGI